MNRQERMAIIASVKIERVGNKWQVSCPHCKVSHVYDAEYKAIEARETHLLRKHSSVVNG